MLYDVREVKVSLPPPKIQARCSECKQVLEDPELKFFQGDSNEAVRFTPPPDLLNDYFPGVGTLADLAGGARERDQPGGSQPLVVLDWVKLRFVVI